MAYWQALWRGGGPLSLDPLRRLLRKTLPVLVFEDLKTPLVVTTTDLLTGTPVYWHGAGDLLEPVVASMSLPGVFPPVTIDGRQLVDGAVASNVPFASALERGARRAGDADDPVHLLPGCTTAAALTAGDPAAQLLDRTGDEVRLRPAAPPATGRGRAGGRTPPGHRGRAARLRTRRCVDGCRLRANPRGVRKVG
ncbi:MAG: patatin-like phospholipase family protein [Rubrivivax sp.]|nr:patatin-like phospholipase family protein [Piscinibacter sp.]MCW5611822.1 patatin-like phospholipase family protein [Rubrivivax sp.]TXH57345.1 MAG: hypothetical protein E6Q93_12650 [Burkholderiaceae bacterium]